MLFILEKSIGGGSQNHQIESKENKWAALGFPLARWTLLLITSARVQGVRDSPCKIYDALIPLIHTIGIVFLLSSSENCAHYTRICYFWKTCIWTDLLYLIYMDGSEANILKKITVTNDILASSQ